MLLGSVGGLLCFTSHELVFHFVGPVTCTIVYSHTQRSGNGYQISSTLMDAPTNDLLPFILQLRIYVPRLNQHNQHVCYL